MPSNALYLKGESDNEAIGGGVNNYFVYGISIEHYLFDFRFQIVPQHKTDHYRLDFAIIGHFEDPQHKSGKRDFKIFVECDGHDFHHTREQRQNDNNRMADLTQDGWIPFRYTGNQILHPDFSATLNFKTFIKNVISKGFQDDIELS